VNLLLETPPPLAAILGIAVGNTLEAVIGGHLVTALSGGDFFRNRPRETTIFLLVGVLACTTISATLGVSSLCLSSSASWNNVSALWWTWWIGDATGALLFTPFLLALWHAKTASAVRSRASYAEVGVFIVVLGAVSVFAFLTRFPIGDLSYPRPALIIPVFVWAVFRLGAIAVTGSILSSACIAIWGTMHQLGPFVLDDQNSSLLLLQGNVGIIAATMLLLSSAMSDQRRTLERVQSDELLLRQLLELQERERKSVAHEIHDGFAQFTIGAKMIIDGARGKFAEMDPDLSASGRLLDKAVTEARRMISGLRPMIIDEKGIVNAVDYLVAEEEKVNSMSVTFTHELSRERFDPTLEAAVFRIVQEALTNARRHSQTKSARVNIRQANSKLTIEVSDQGVGFNVDDVPSDRFGLRGIRERARLFNGKASIKSSPGEGTVIVVQVPIDVSD
jgi:signal transduction histidine kinase